MSVDTTLATDTERSTRIYVEIGKETDPVLIRWTTWWARPGGRDSYALLTGDGPLLIDPMEPADAVASDLWSLIGRRPTAIFLTNDWHERDSYTIGSRWGTPVWGPGAGLRERGGEFDGQPDFTFEDGTVLPGGVRTIKVSGAFPGDSVLVWQRSTGERVLFTGDVIQNQTDTANPKSADHWRNKPGLYLYAAPLGVKRLRDADRLKVSLLPLLEGDVSLICGSHGQPYRSNTKRALRQLLEMDWLPFLERGLNPSVIDDREEPNNT
jgi:hypothetical protein